MSNDVVNTITQVAVVALTFGVALLILELVLAHKQIRKLNEMIYGLRDSVSDEHKKLEHARDALAKAVRKHAIMARALKSCTVEHDGIVPRFTYDKELVGKAIDEAKTLR